ncbi:tyrosine-protein phosphatase [Mycobacterium sp. SM1]|uniref:tyrosine-protein phosphatase n=1 Tax=Mycobacterium sp. SM1 TaxID=2816243 RepID=UPI001BCB6A7D|nr:tyrosine-protein phosphatase [Mycobacterium sp. SM1]MBS4727869.1 tyrosine-protein phosphatase [Mycobacterium sp. SM1]
MAASSRELKGAWNFRDVAESVDGLRPGRLFRSSELSRLHDDGRAALTRLGVTDVADLRSPREVARRGAGRVPDGVDIHLLPFPDLGADQADANGTAPHEQAFRQLLAENRDDEPPERAAARYMIEEYRRFPTANGAEHAVRQVISLLAAGRSLLAHCFAGKDRTGFIVAVVLEAIGVERDAILADYLRSNDAAPCLRSRILEMVTQRADAGLTPEVVTFVEARLCGEVLGVREEYLAAARQAIDQSYGSLDGYLRAAGVTATDVTRVRGALLS